VNFVESWHAFITTITAYMLWGIVDQEPIAKKVDISVQDGSWRTSLVSQFPLCSRVKVSLAEGEIGGTKKVIISLKDY
jgi:hypothetical protein